MTGVQKVVLYGNSLFMAGVEASLKGRDGLDVVRIDATLPGAGSQLNALCPHAVVFDLADPPLGFVIPFLKEHPDLPLVGLDVNSNAVLVLSSRRYTALTADDLARVIQEQIGSGKLAEREGPG